MFKKILIANRGEIACRVIRTCKRLGIATVAVYSEADRDALHVRMADEAVAHRARRRRPELSGHRQDHCRPAKATGRRGGASGLRLPVGERAISPRRWRRPASPSSARRRRRSRPWATRSSRRSLPHEAGVSTVPGHIGRDRRRRRGGRRSPREIGYPVMIKASAGGGGKGMRIACNDDRGARGLPLGSKNEAKSSFGDDRVFIEKFIEEPRHIEIQVLGDGHGNMRLSRRARMLDPAPPPEGHRGGAVALSSTRRPARRWASRPSRWPGPSTTTRPARSSSSSTATATSISSR